MLARVLPLDYLPAYVALMLVFDAAILALVVLRSRTTAGGWIWVLGGLALGPIVLARFDVVPAAFAVGGLAALEAPVLAGAVLALGAWTKIWPAVLALASPRVASTGRVLVGMVLVSALAEACLLITGNAVRAFAFLGYQKVRGLQIESLGATPFLFANALAGRPSTHPIVYAYGTHQITGPGTALAVALCTAASVAVLAWYIASTVRAWRRPRPASAGLWRALAVVLLLMLASRVLSPQYLIWALAIAALVAARVRGTAAVVGGIVVAAAALSQLVFPFRYQQLIDGRLEPAVLLAARNALLVTAAGLAVWRAERSTAPEAAE
jgi:hypothetical protein